MICTKIQRTPISKKKENSKNSELQTQAKNYRNTKPECFGHEGAMFRSRSRPSRPLVWSGFVSASASPREAAAVALSVSSATARWRLMCPPSACPSGNSTPHTAHPCARAFAGAASLARGRLWLARCPPSAWNDGNRRLHVLHSNTRGEADGSPPPPPPPRASSSMTPSATLMMPSSAGSSCPNASLLIVTKRSVAPVCMCDVNYSDRLLKYL